MIEAILSFLIYIVFFCIISLLFFSELYFVLYIILLLIFARVASKIAGFLVKGI